MAGAPWWSPTGDGIILQVRASPGAKRSEIIGVADGRLRIRVHAPPVDGKANKELIRVLAEWLGVRRSAIAIVRGDHTREKAVRVVGIAAPPDPESHGGSV